LLPLADFQFKAASLQLKAPGESPRMVQSPKLKNYNTRYFLPLVPGPKKTAKDVEEIVPFDFRQFFLRTAKLARAFFL